MVQRQTVSLYLQFVTHVYSNVIVTEYGRRTKKTDRVQYMCRSCYKTGKSGNIVRHFFKYHVPFPFSCSMCNFCFPAQQHFAEQVTQYVLYVREADSKAVMDLRLFRKKVSANPYICKQYLARQSQRSVQGKQALYIRHRKTSCQLASWKCSEVYF